MRARHGTPEVFAQAVERALGEISIDEANAAVAKYHQIYKAAPEPTRLAWLEYMVIAETYSMTLPGEFRGNDWIITPTDANLKAVVKHDRPHHARCIAVVLKEMGKIDVDEEARVVSDIWTELPTYDDRVKELAGRSPAVNLLGPYVP